VNGQERQACTSFADCNYEGCITPAANQNVYGCRGVNNGARMYNNGNWWNSGMYWDGFDNNRCVRMIYSTWTQSYCPKRCPDSCPSGQYVLNCACAECPAGSACTGSPPVKTTCTAGTFSNASASSCTTCAPNSFSGIGASSCTICPPG
jgi:hypothetical protein